VDKARGKSGAWEEKKLASWAKRGEKNVLRVTAGQKKRGCSAMERGRVARASIENLDGAGHTDTKECVRSV